MKEEEPTEGLRVVADLLHDATKALSPFPVGTRVVLTGLQKAPQHNGKTGVIVVADTAPTDERLAVRLIGVTVHRGPPLGIKPANLRLAHVR